MHSPDEIYQGISKYFAQKPSRKMQISLKDLFLAEDIEKFKLQLDIFKELYVDNKIIMLLLSNKENEIEAFYKYNYCVFFT